MSDPTTRPKRFIGLDVHKHYLIALGVDAELQVVLPARRVELSHLEAWMRKTLTQQDAVVLEMSTNTWALYDELSQYAQSVTVVHPPHVALITRSQVMTDKIAASILARLLAKGLLVGIWVPPQEVRDLRALIAQRSKLTRLATQAKNRLHALLQRHHILPPAGNLFHEDQDRWWNALAIGKLEKLNMHSDLETLRFAEAQLAQLTTLMNDLAAQDERAWRLIHLPGFGVIIALSVLAAIGEIERFPTAKKLVGYAGLGTRVHDSGLTLRTGRITKAGRKDLRAALVEAAQTAANTHPHWQAELARLEPHLGRNKAIVAIARKLLVLVWHVLAKGATDRFAEPEQVARKLMQLAYKIGKRNRPTGQSTAQFVRDQLDALQLGSALTAIPWGTKKKPIPLPPGAKTVSDVPST
ncbi:MAG TPA: IS110 family transposase [Anaerolineales bacterium]|nr:IS110 family transposase [Anaerolineales bacterium]